MRWHGGVVAVALLLTACAEATPPPPATPVGSQALLTALRHVADTEVTRPQFAFSDIAGLHGLTGQDWDTVRWTGLHYVNPATAPLVGFSVDKATYAITAGADPGVVSLLIGGQDRTTVTDGLRGSGWSVDGDRLLPPGGQPAMSPATDNLGALMPAGQASVTGADVVLAGQTGNLADATPAGRPTLAAHPQLAVLAACLGEVVAARARLRLPEHYLSMAATGVRPPAAPGGKATVVLCTISSEPDKTAATLRDALQNGKSRGVPFSTIYTDATVTVIDGPTPVVRVEAATAKADTMLTTFTGYGLPGETGQPDV